MSPQRQLDAPPRGCTASESLTTAWSTCIHWRSSVVPTVHYRSIKRASVYILVVLTPQCRSPALPEAIRRPPPSLGGVQDDAAADDARTSMRGAATRPGPAAPEIVRTRPRADPGRPSTRKPTTSPAWPVRSALQIQCVAGGLVDPR